jgi:hypothetical protein
MPTALMSSDPPEVFISYSHKDKEWLKLLETHLKVLKQGKMITFWHGRRINPGQDWQKEIDKHLRHAQIVLLLVSVDFLASDYCYGVELKRAMKRHEEGTAWVIPVILRPCEWRGTPFGHLQALPEDGKPVVNWENIDDAFVSVTEGIRQVAEIIATEGIKQIILKFDNGFDEERFKERLRVDVGIDLKRITISVHYGSIEIIIKGDSEELVRIVNALSNPELLWKLIGPAKPKSIAYINHHREYSIPLSLPPREILREAIRAVPAVKYALGVAGIAAVVVIFAGFSIDYKVAVLGTIVITGLMFGLVAFSSFASYSSTSIRPLAFTLAWTFVLLTSATSLCIFTGFFFSWPRPLEAYLYPRPTPTPTPLPTPTPEPSPTPTLTPQPFQILISKVPPYDPVGGPIRKELIAGKVLGAGLENYSIVIYSFTNVWYVQPTTAEPRTPIDSNGNWEADIQTGTRYAILLVPRDYQPPDKTSHRPTLMSGVVASQEIEGKKESTPAHPQP